MNLFESLEIYIPVEAEVKSIPLSSLPNSVLRRMGLSLSDTESSRKLTESPKGIWICPAVLRRKGQKAASYIGNSMLKNMTSLMGKEFRAAPGPFRMSFVSSSHTAYKVLKDTMPGKKVSTHTSHISMLPQASAPLSYQGAVVIYHGRIYLSIRKLGGSQSQQETHEPQPSSQSSIPSSSDMASKAQKKRQSPQAALEPADKQPKRKRSHVSLPQISPKQPKDLLTKTDQELSNDNSAKKKHATCKVTHSENRKDVMHRGRDVSSSKTARSVPQSTDSVHNLRSHCPKDARGEQAAEEAAGPDPAWFHPQGEQEEVVNNDGETQDLGSEEADSTNQSNDMNCNIKIDNGDPDNIVGFVEQSGNQSWTRRESQGAACASIPLQQEFDFKELAQEEMIARMKAKLRQNEAALNILHSSS